MTCRICLRLGILVFLATLCSSSLLFAQSQACADSASPPPVSVQETKISIVDVEFQGENLLSDAQREQLIKHIQQQDLWTNPEEPDSSWVNQALELLKNVGLRELGYFRANVEGTPYLVLAQANERHYVLRIAIESGPKYRLGTIRFASASDAPLIFTESLLREQIQLQEGEVFDASKVREGLEAIGRLYGSKGYIDATSEPDTTIDEEGSRIDLLIRLDQQQPYRIAKIAFRGLDANAQLDPKLPQEIGDPFHPALWHHFFKDNEFHLFPGGYPDKNMQIQKNVPAATLDITFDFRPCPQTDQFDQ